MPRTKNATGVNEHQVYYRTELVTKHGLSAETLREARKSGIVRAIEVAGRDMYDGKELIEYFRKCGKRKRPNSAIRQLSK